MSEQRKNVLILGHNNATQFIDIYNQYTHLFDRDQYEVTVACLTGTENDEDKQRLIAENVIFFNFKKKSLRYLKLNAIKALFLLCKQKQFQIVICHRYKPTYLLLWVAQWIKIPALIFVMHELGTMSSWGRQWLVKSLLKKNMVLAGVSNAVRDDLRKDLTTLAKEQIITLYNVIDVKLTEPFLFSKNDARKLLDLNENDFVFGNIARLAPNKDQESLIHAFSLLKQTCSNAKLVIIGDGHLEQQLKQQIKEYQLEHSVILTGFLRGGFRYMKAFDCFVLSSTQEAFGRVLLEAMIAEVPIIATKVNGIPEVIGESGGQLVAAKNSTELMASMQKIYHTSPEDRSSQGKKAYKWMDTYFSIHGFQQTFWQLPLLQAIKV